MVCGGCPKLPARFVVPGSLCVEEASAFGIEKAFDHPIRDTTREVEIAEIASRFVSIEASQSREGIVVQQSWNLAPLRIRIE